MSRAIRIVSNSRLLWRVKGCRSAARYVLRALRFSQSFATVTK
jgi:hypothetical protein